MKVCFVRPPTLTTTESLGEDTAAPIGVAYLAACLRKVGHDVTIIDALGEALDLFSSVQGMKNGLRHGLGDEDMIKMIPDDTEIIGVSTMFSQAWPYDRDLIVKIRERFTNVPIVVGGEHVTALPEYSLEDCPAIDFVLLGEAEQSLVDLVDTLEQGSDISDVQGLWFRHEGALKKTDSRKRIREIDEIPLPAWDLIPIEAYVDANSTFGVNLGDRPMPMLASRGCPFQCTFCSNPVMYGTLWRSRSPQEVFEEMCGYMEKYGANSFDFYDLTAIVKRSWIIEFCNLIIESGRQFTWQLPSGTRSEALDEEVTGLLYSAGCRYIVYAPESGSPEVLEIIKKKVSIPKMLTSIRGAHKNKMGIKTNIILGFPGETMRHVLETYGFICRVAVSGATDLTCFPFSPYPGSELFDLLRKRGRIKVDAAYFRALSQYTDPGKAESFAENFSSRQLRFLCIAGIGLFYLLSYSVRPIRFLRLIRNVYQLNPKNKIEAPFVRVIRKRRMANRNKHVLVDV